MIVYLKIATMLYFRLSDIYGLGRLHELPFIIIAQGAAKLWPVKVDGPKKLPHASPFYLVKRGSIPAEKISFKTSIFCSPLSYNNE